MITKYLARLTVGVVLSISTFGVVHASGPFTNCAEYVKLGTPGLKGEKLCRTGYALAHNPDTKTPFWVAEHLTAEKASAARARSNDFQSDPDLEEGERAELADYKQSGFDRGHMAPAANMRWSREAMSESFFLSNMAPQVGAGMNRGIWKELEEKVRQWAVDREELYIYTGPIYESQDIQTIGTNKVGVPTHFYKIVYDPLQVEVIAFIMPNQKLKTEDMPSYIVSVREVEAKTGLNFLSKLKKRVQDQIEVEPAAALWDLN
jgi:endonuclease G